MTTTTFERYPTFEFSADQLSVLHCSRRQLGRQDDIANSVLVMVSAVSKANATGNTSRSVAMQNRLVKFLNNNATGRVMISPTEAQYTFGFGNGVCGVIHNLETGRFQRAK